MSEPNRDGSTGRAHAVGSGMGIFVGIVMGSVVGSITDTLALSLSFGICLGLLVDSVIQERRKRSGGSYDAENITSSGPD
jgi:uncharacterized membrane protein YfcA